MSLLLGKIGALSWVGVINPTDVLARAANDVFMALSELRAVSKEFIALAINSIPRLGCASVTPVATARASSSSFRQNGPSRSVLSAGMVRPCGSPVGPELAPASDVSAVRLLRAKTRPIVASCQILRRQIDDILHTRRLSFFTAISDTWRGRLRCSFATELIVFERFRSHL